MSIAFLHLTVKKLKCKERTHLGGHVLPSFNSSVFMWGPKDHHTHYALEENIDLFD